MMENSARGRGRFWYVLFYLTLTYLLRILVLFMVSLIPWEGVCRGFSCLSLLRHITDSLPI